MPTGTGCSSRRGPSSSTEECTKKKEGIEYAGEGKNMCRKGYFGSQNFPILALLLWRIGTKFQREHTQHCSASWVVYYSFQDVS